MNGEGNRIFVDTNVLVYEHDRLAGAKRDQARVIMSSLWSTSLGCLSVQVLQEFYNAITRKVPKPVDSAFAQSIVRKLATWSVHSPTSSDVIEAIEIERRYGVSFWDSMIVQSAIQMGCNEILSEDLGPGQEYYGVRVVNPFADAGQAES